MRRHLTLLDILPTCAGLCDAGRVVTRRVAAAAAMLICMRRHVRRGGGGGDAPLRESNRYVIVRGPPRHGHATNTKILYFGGEPSQSGLLGTRNGVGRSG